MYGEMLSRSGVEAFVVLGAESGGMVATAADGAEHSDSNMGLCVLSEVRCCMSST